MDALLETPAVSGAQAARFTLGAAGRLPAGLSGAAAEQAAWAAAMERGWVSGQAGRALRLKEAALLVTGAFSIKGGLMYSVFPGPRYAYRELLYLKIIQGRADGNFTVSGERLLQILGRALQYTGDRPAAEALTVPAGQGVSSGPEDILPYEGEFEIE
jgi:hypothetical protein